MFNIKGVSTPTLIQHGEADRRVPISQAYELYNALLRQKVPVKMVVYPRQPHGLQEPKLIKDAMERNVECLDRWVLDRSETSRGARGRSTGTHNTKIVYGSRITKNAGIF